MKSKEEMIAIIEEAIDYDDSREGNAKYILKALCGALPDVKYIGAYHDISTATELYNQLKQWGK